MTYRERPVSDPGGKAPPPPPPAPPRRVSIVVGPPPAGSVGVEDPIASLVSLRDRAWIDRLREGR